MHAQARLVFDPATTMSVEKKAHLAAFTFPFASHPTPLLHLIKRLAAVLPDVHFSYFSTKSSNSKVCPKVNIHGYENIKIYDVDDGLPEGYIFSGNPKEIIEFFIKATPDNFRKRIEEVVDETGMKATCLLTDAFLWFSADIAEQMGIPWLAFWPSGHQSFSLHMHTGMSCIRGSDLPGELLHIDWSLSHLLYNMQQTIKRSTAVIINSFDGIASTVENDLRSKFQSLLNIGPFPLPQSPTTEDQSGCLSWLNHQKTASVVYVSFGTTLLPPLPELIALGEALEEKHLPYLWSFRDDSKHRALENFFERTKSLGKVVEWAPQLEILSHPSIGVFVTHCGWNSTLESIIGGVPMICRPIFADQLIYRRFTEEVWRIGAAVEGGVFTKSAVMNALDLVMVKAEGRKMKENIQKLKKRSLMAVAENGTSTENFKSLTTLIASLT